MGLRLEREAKVLHRIAAPERGTFFGPVLAELADAGFLQARGVRPWCCMWSATRRADLERHARILANIGYGLTLGVHSRIEAFAETIRRLVPAGNAYVNRSIIGAVVGVQPFGGESRPVRHRTCKVGGLGALARYAVERKRVSVNIASQGGGTRPCSTCNRPHFGIGLETYADEEVTPVARQGTLRS